jgi:hypothetical protein
VVVVLALGLNGALQRILGDDEGLVAVVKALGGGDDALVQSMQ